MFGLMRAKKCGMSADEKHFRRLHYCGTCKTIGSLYGQKSRLLLNHDTVFLSEFLTSLSGENVGDWQKSYQSYNCLSLPKAEMPISLQFAATANVVLSEFKIADHIEDSHQKRFKIAHRIFSKEFLKAEKSLKDWNFPLEEVSKLLKTQAIRERENKSLDEFALPTASVTATFFAHGVQLIGKNELKNIASEIGFAFGKLIYLLDAFEDYEKDAKSNQFNAIRANFNLKETKIPTKIKRKVTTILNELESKIISNIYELPIAESQKAIFASRLQTNLQRKLQTNLPVIQTKKVCAPKPKQTFAKKWQKATETARNMARGFTWQMPLVFLFIFVFALVAPAQSREAKSARECFDLSFNLMFLGAIFGGVVSSIGAVFAMDGEPPPTPLSSGEDIGKVMPAPKLRRGLRGGPGSNGGCCIGCDCCDCCDCADCGCDGCDCCSGCCDSCGDCGSCCDC